VNLRLRLVSRGSDRPLRVASPFQPVTVIANALRGLTLGEGALSPGQDAAGQTLLALAWTAGIMVVFAPLAVSVYRRSTS